MTAYSGIEPGPGPLARCELSNRNIWKHDLIKKIINSLKANK